MKKPSEILCKTKLKQCQGYLHKKYHRNGKEFHRYCALGVIINEVCGTVEPNFRVPFLSQLNALEEIGITGIIADKIIEMNDEDYYSFKDICQYLKSEGL